MKINKVTICSLLFMFAMICLLFIPAIVKGQAIESTPTEILQSPDKYDGKMVQVEGKVFGPNFKRFKMGYNYTTFEVTDSQNNALPVFSFGTLPIEQDDTVKVMGRFQKVLHVRPYYTFYNEIDASEGSVEKIK